MHIYIYLYKIKIEKYNFIKCNNYFKNIYIFWIKYLIYFEIKL